MKLGFIMLAQVFNYLGGLKTGDSPCNNFKNISFCFPPFDDCFNLQFNEPPSCSTIFWKGSASGEQFVEEMEKTPIQIEKECKAVISNITQPYSYIIWQELPVQSYPPGDQAPVLECYHAELTSNQKNINSNFFDCANSALYAPINKVKSAYNLCSTFKVIEFSMFAVSGAFVVVATCLVYINYNRISGAFRQCRTRMGAPLLNRNSLLFSIPSRSESSDTNLPIPTDTNSTLHKRLLSPKPIG